jgi:hypothetical protein
VNPVAATVSDLTPAWLTQALRAAGTDVTVAHVEPERVGTGQIGTSYRLTLTYDGDADDAPRSLVAKLAGGDEAARRRVADGYRKEVGFYTELAATVDVRTPRCWYGAITDDGTDFTLLLDDLAPARPGVQADGCTVDQAADSVRNLAGLHAPRWDDTSLLEHPFLGPADAGTAGFLGEILVVATEEFVERYAGDLGSDDVRTLRDAARVIADWQLARPTPFALIHGDYRLDNLMFPPSGDGVVALDWQTVTVGPPTRDVAYFLGTSLDLDARRQHEEQLVAVYHDELVARGIVGYAADACFDDYRLGHLQGPMITVLGCIYATAERSERADGMFLAMATRSCAAIRDLGSVELV